MEYYKHPSTKEDASRNVKGRSLKMHKLYKEAKMDNAKAIWERKKIRKTTKSSHVRCIENDDGRVLM